MTMTVDTPSTQAPTTDADTLDLVPPTADAEPETTSTTVASDPQAPVEPPKKAPAKKSAGRKTKTLELTLVVTGTADGEWRAELKQGSTYVVRDLAVTAAAVSRAAKELHDDLSGPIDEVIEEARSQQAARVAALEAELAAARQVLAELD